MKITLDYFTKFIIKIFDARKWYEDYHTLHNQQLEIILKHMNMQGLISVDKNGINFKPINDSYVNTSNIDTDKYEPLRIFDYAAMTVNSILEKRQQEMTIRSGGQLCTNEHYEKYHHILQSQKLDYALSTLSSSMKNIYDDFIKDNLSLMYGKNYSVDNVKNYDSRKKIPGWNLNSIVTDENELEILKKSLDPYDYF